MSTNPETPHFGPENNFESARDLANEFSEKLKENREKVGEHSPERTEKSTEKARADALENAVSVESNKLTKEKTRSPAVRRGSIKQERDASYKRTIAQVQAELSGPSRTFSKIIHNKTVEKASEAVGATVARPNAILAGSIAAFVFTLALYLLAKHFGYQLSGFETIGAFILGWVIGQLFDFFRVMITGKHS
jgi:hypothetical protein